MLKQYLPRYSTEQARRHEMRPGITGIVRLYTEHGGDKIWVSARVRHSVRPILR